jgi:hypothetical protein
VYAKQKLSPSSPRAAVFWGLFLAIVFLYAPAPSRADSVEDGLEALALKVCMPSRKQSVRMNWQEPPERPDIFSESAKNAFLAQLSACGLEITENSEAPLLNIAVQFTPSRLLLIAVIGGAFEPRSARVIEIPRTALAVSSEVLPLVHLRKELLWQQEKPIHSAMEWHDSSTQEQYLFLLSQGLFVRLRSKNEVWVEVDSAELPKSDRRSRTVDSTFVYKYPEAKLELLAARKLCDFDPGGRLSFTCVDTNLGGKTARLSSGCGGPLRDIWTDAGDQTQRDHIFFGRARVAGAVFPPDDPMSRSLEMPGPVFDVGNTQDSRAVIAVVRNLVTGNYEVYRITLACAN